jgi:hypothetical protein
MPTHFPFMPIDRTTYVTRLRIHPDLLDDPNAYIRKYDLPIRTSKAGKGTSRRVPTRNLTLDVLTYSGIKAKLSKVTDEPLTDVTIDFNPGVCLYGHNGTVLSLDEFLEALAILVTHLKPLLSDQSDWVDLIPGLRSKGVANWSSLEILLQCADSNGRLLAGFRNAQRNNGKITIRHWPESIVIGGKNSLLQFGIYLKAVEMVAHKKLPAEQLENYQHILRLEVRLKGDKLAHYLGNERNVEEIDGVMKLVRFYPQDVVSAHRKSFGELHGVYHSDDPLAELQSGDQLSPLGRLLARVALAPGTSQTFQELLAHVRFYTGARPKTIGAIRQAGIAQLARLSTLSKDELYSDTAYRAQHSIASKELEQKVRHELQDTIVHRLITDAYRPPDQPLQPLTEWPGYLRL